MRLIGLSGYGQVGKDAVGEMLVGVGWTRFAKGDLLKDAAYAINPFIVTLERDEGGEVREVHDLRWLVDTLGWEAAKGHQHVRRFLQDLADEVVGVCGRDVWNDRLYETMLQWVADAEKSGSQADIILTRLSLPQEVETLRAHGGFLVRVERDGYGPANGHPNEVALDHVIPDYTIRNMGTLDGLRESVSRMLNHLYPAYADLDP